MQENLLDRTYLNDMLGSFARTTGLYVEAVNNDGETIFVPDNRERCQFCKFVRQHPGGQEKCRESYQRANAEAAKWEEPYFFRCHAGLVIWAVPIILNGSSIGSIICGQVLMWRPDEFFWQEFKILNSDITSFNKLKEFAGQLEVVSPERTQAAADMLFVVVSYLVKRNIHILEENEAIRIQRQEIRRQLEERKQNTGLKINNYHAYLKKERKLLRFIRLGDRTRTEETLHSLLADLFAKAAGDKETIRVRILELATLVSRAAVEGGVDAEQAMVMLEEFNAEINKLEEIEEFFYKIYSIVEELLSNIFALTDKKYLSLVKEARTYIMENYYKTIQIEDVAESLFISSSHLSRLFRQEINCTVNEYLTRVRIEKAVELMKKPELSVAQVSQAVGIKNQSYFAKVFRKYIGVTPLVYRNSLF